MSARTPKTAVQEVARSRHERPWVACVGWRSSGSPSRPAVVAEACTILCNHQAGNGAPRRRAGRVDGGSCRRRLTGYRRAETRGSGNRERLLRLVSVPFFVDHSARPSTDALPRVATATSNSHQVPDKTGLSTRARFGTERRTCDCAPWLDEFRNTCPTKLEVYIRSHSHWAWRSVAI